MAEGTKGVVKTATGSKEKNDVTMEVDPLRIHVGNLNWMVPKEEITTQLTQIVSPPSFSDGNMVSAKVQVREKTHKKRDVDKCHGGSALLIFDNPDDAKLGMDRLNAFCQANSKSDIVGENAKLLIRWYLTRNEPKEKERLNIQELTPLQIERRQERAARYARKRRRIATRTDEVLNSLLHILPPIEEDDRVGDPLKILDVPPMDWDAVPSDIDPMRGGGIEPGSQRGLRKQAQVEAFWHVLSTAFLDDDDEENQNDVTVADLGSGAGNLSLPIAWLLQDRYKNRKEKVSVRAVDINGRALDRFLNRAKDLGISSSVSAVREDLLQLISTKDEEEAETDVLHACSAILSLHACGAASDLAIAAAVSRSLPFCVSPCCIGKVNRARTRSFSTTSNPNFMPSMTKERSATPSEITYPRSKLLSNEKLDPDDYGLILSSADYSAPDVRYGSDIDLSGFDMEKVNRGRRSKLIVETDRLAYAKEHGYNVRMVEIPRMGPLYPKRELLLGAKAGTSAALRISQLPTSTSLFAKRDDNEYAEDVSLEEDVSETVEGSSSGGLDAKGFAGYLAPYALALLLSIAVTGAFVKFVLLDY